MSYHSVGALQYNTRRGVFRPGGRGGGIFDGTIAGLGALGAVPASCWSVAGFNDCHLEQFGKAQQFCFAQTDQWLKDRGYADRDACIKQTDSAYTQENCVPNYCGTSAASSTSVDTGTKYPWNAYSADTLALQTQTNKALKEAGYCPIGTDGKLGKGTCGAVRKLLGQAPSTCQGFTEPSKPPCASAAVSVYSAPSSATLTAEQQASLTAQYSSGGSWTKYALFAAGAAGVLALAFYLDKKRKK